MDQEDVVAVAEPAGDDMTDMKLFPALFASAMDADRTAPNSLLIGLHSTAEDIGHLGTVATESSSN
jgi:hypothetical protein